MSEPVEPSPFEPHRLSAEWRDMAALVYALVARKPVEYLFLLEDGRYLVCSASELRLYRPADDGGSAEQSEAQRPIAWRIASSW